MPDHALRARQTLRFIQSEHVSKTDESYTTIHDIDPGFYRLRALANSTPESPDEEKWLSDWETRKGAFQTWTKVNLKKWVRTELSAALQREAKTLKKQDEDAAALSTNVASGQKATDEETTKALWPEDNTGDEPTTTEYEATGAHSETGESDAAQPSYISPPLIGGLSKPEDPSPPPSSTKDQSRLDSESNDLKEPEPLVPQSTRSPPSSAPAGFDSDFSTGFSPSNTSTNPASVVHKPQTPGPGSVRPPSQLGVNAPVPSSLGVRGDAGGQGATKDLFGASIIPFGNLATVTQPQHQESTLVASGGPQGLGFAQSRTPIVTKSPKERTPSSATPKTPAQAPSHPLTLTTEPTAFATGHGKFTTLSPAREKAPKPPSTKAVPAFDMGAKFFNAIPSAANFFSGSLPTPKMATGHVGTPTQGESSAQGRAGSECVSRVEKGQFSKLTLANLSLHEASPEGVGGPESNKPPKEWYEWYKNRHMDQKDRH